MITTKKLAIVFVFSVAVITCLYADFLNEALAACHEPSRSTEFCVDTEDVNTNLNLKDSCTDVEVGCDLFGVVERNKFPLGPEEADKGTTTEEPADCYQVTQWVADPDTGGCKAADDGQGWNDGDKTVVDEEADPCPPEGE